VDRALSRAPRGPDGRIRAVASRYLAGRPLGPWRYEGLREGDRNDVVPHEDRRELRGSRLLAAWTGHWDARAQNTLAMWIETAPGRGFVRHHILDFGDCFGAFSGATPVLIRRRGEVYFYDPWQALADFATLGAVERPWDRGKLGPSGAVFGYYDVDSFEPEAWTTSFPNVAFGRMTEHDAAWMARIIARIEPPEVQAMVSTAALSDQLAAELLRVLLGRRQKMLERYLQRLSPLASPTFALEDGRIWLCTDDLAALIGVASPRSYSARAWAGPEPGVAFDLPVRARGPGRVCAPLPGARAASPTHPEYHVLEVSTQAAGHAPFPARFHVYRDDRNGPSLVRVERLESPAD
jgi:hypothetical protein